MEKKPLHFLKYFLICSVCFSVSAMAMQRDANECNSSLSIKKSVKGYPTPPVITYEDYVTSLCFEDGEIEGWGEPTGQIAAWIGKPENKKHLVDLDGTFLNDLPFFQITLNPVIDNNRLRCDYTLPAPKTDLYQGKTPILSLYYNANLEEMSAVRKSMQENNLEFWERLAKWHSILKKKQQVTKARTSRLMDPLKFIPQDRQATDNLSLAIEQEYARYPGIFSYIPFQLEDTLLII